MSADAPPRLAQRLLLRACLIALPFGCAALAPSTALAQGPAPTVTICHANGDDTFTTIVVPEGDPQIAEHTAHPGDIVGGDSCPANEPITPEEEDLEPPCDAPCPPDDEEIIDEGEDPTPVAQAPGTAPPAPPSAGTAGGTELPTTGADAGLLALVMAGLVALAYGFRRTAKHLR